MKCNLGLVLQRGKNVYPMDGPQVLNAPVSLPVGLFGREGRSGTWTDTSHEWQVFFPMRPSTSGFSPSLASGLTEHCQVWIETEINHLQHHLFSLPNPACIKTFFVSPWLIWIWFRYQSNHKSTCKLAVVSLWIRAFSGISRKRPSGEQWTWCFNWLKNTSGSS